MVIFHFVFCKRLPEGKSNPLGLWLKTRGAYGHNHHGYHVESTATICLIIWKNQAQAFQKGDVVKTCENMWKPQKKIITMFCLQILRSHLNILTAGGRWFIPVHPADGSSSPGMSMELGTTAQDVFLKSCLHIKKKKQHPHVRKKQRS